jgi:hypothetical protein
MPLILRCTSVFQKQIDRLEGFWPRVRGPLIVSGDFNTWTSGRMSRVNAMANALALPPSGSTKTADPDFSATMSITFTIADWRLKMLRHPLFPPLTTTRSRLCSNWRMIRPPGVERRAVASLIAILALCIAFHPCPAHAGMQSEIDHLLQYIETSDCTFTRNGNHP